MQSTPTQSPAPSPVKFAVLLSIFISTVYYVIGCFHGPDGHPAPIIRDAYMFHQYARQLAEGHPW